VLSRPVAIPVASLNSPQHRCRGRGVRLEVAQLVILDIARAPAAAGVQQVADAALLPHHGHKGVGHVRSRRSARARCSAVS